jgi:hypothetical protein
MMLGTATLAMVDARIITIDPIMPVVVTSQR